MILHKFGLGAEAKLCNGGENLVTEMHSFQHLTVIALAMGVLSLSAFAPSLGGLWGMLSIQAHIRASAQEKHRHRQSIHRFPNISADQKK